MNRDTLGKILCWLQLHRWYYLRYPGPADVFPFHGVPYRRPFRKCLRCKTKQKWIPGYGGSEIGFWAPHD